MNIRSHSNALLVAGALLVATSASSCGKPTADSGSADRAISDTTSPAAPKPHVDAASAPPRLAPTDKTKPILEAIEKMMKQGESENGDAERLPPPNRIEFLSEDSVVARTTVEPKPPRSGLDHYLFLKREDNAWRVTAHRALASYGWFDMILERDRAQPSTDPQMRWMVRNAKLALLTDHALRRWFEDNVDVLNSVRDAIVTGGQASSTDDTPTGKLLHENAILTASRSKDGNIEIILGGVSDNTVGFLFSPDDTPPPIDPDNYIWIEPIRDQWYLFRTT